jgi:hypothetical protein
MTYVSLGSRLSKDMSRHANHCPERTERAMLATKKIGGGKHVHDCCDLNFHPQSLDDLCDILSDILTRACQ